MRWDDSVGFLDGHPVCSYIPFPPNVGEMPQAPPSSSPAIPSLPKSPDRPGSTSPFAPAAADLPSMPEPALTSRANITGKGLRACERHWREDSGLGGRRIAADDQAHTRLPAGTSGLSLCKQAWEGVQGVEGLGGWARGTAGESMSHLKQATSLYQLLTWQESPVWPDLLNRQQDLEILIFYIL